MNTIVCPQCGSEHVIKNGNQKGFQGYICKVCKKKFSFGKYEPKKKIVNEKKEKRNKTDKLFDLGFRWETLVEKILREQGKNLEKQKVIDNNRRIDFMYDQTIIECKLSAGTEELLLTIQKYADYCDKLEIWSLNKCSQERISTYITKEEVLRKMERKIGRWHDYISEFEKKNINVEMFYFDDIVKMIQNEDILHEINSIYKEYREIQPDGGRVTSFENELSMDFESYLKDIDNSLDINKNIYINNAIKKHYRYRVKEKGIKADDYNPNWQINGIIKLKDLKRFKIPYNYYSAKADDNLKECSFLELEMEYINKNTFVNYETIFDCFNLTDNSGTVYKNIPGYLLDNQIISNWKTTFIQRHVDDMHPNKPRQVKLYYKIPDDFPIQDLKLEFEEDKQIIIVLDKPVSSNNNYKSNNTNPQLVNELEKEEIEKKTNNIKDITKKCIIITLISVFLILVICYAFININKNNNDYIEEKIYQQEIKNEISENNGIEDKNNTNANLININSKENENTEIYNKNENNYESNQNNPNKDIVIQNKSTNVIRVGMTKQEIVSICGEPKPSNISHEGNLNAKNKGNFGAYDEFWYYSKNSQKFGIYFLYGKVVGISATNSKTKLSGPVNSLTIY